MYLVSLYYFTKMETERVDGKKEESSSEEDSSEEEEEEKEEISYQKLIYYETVMPRHSCNAMVT